MDRRMTEIMDSETVLRTLKRIAHQILERTKDTKDIVLIGIRRRGVSVAECIAEQIENIAAAKIPVGILDVTFYRDDMNEMVEKLRVDNTNVNFDVTGKNVVLVDDVLYTGRTARAAMDAIMDMGRPAWIKFAVLVDRGHRELPIKADFVGKNVPTAPNERITVKMPEFDGGQGVYLERVKE
ncbi:bifunctional pyr operon transcriptional regulator/uracil phosphoribosyltransferase PyrR [Christensenellaceae bacterium OttesenSCG-928-K19]|nr:bifunctional pyr operon transcriptional regulator/uracil phosphoribosyltransferase PyrR [Christensenellaceae bacterium OttesenSCG-928-K19]